MISLLSDPTSFIITILAIVYAITVHEFSHVFAAYVQGDDTGRLMGRLTLNPLAHLDFLGSVLLLLVGFGWGKPAPYNPYNLKYQRWGEVLVALAGPAANLISIIVFGFAGMFLLTVLPPANLLISFLFVLVLVNTVLMIFNLIPIPPLDGSKLLFEILPDRYHHVRVSLSQNGPWILLGLIIADNFLGINIFGHLFGIFFRVTEIFF